MNYLRAFDIIFLQETWVQESLSLLGFNSLILPATKSNLRGQQLGGLAIFVVDYLKVSFLTIPPNACLMQAVKITCGHMILIFINVYILPQLSSALNT